MHILSILSFKNVTFSILDNLFAISYTSHSLF